MDYGAPAYNVSFFFLYSTYLIYYVLAPIDASMGTHICMYYHLPATTLPATLMARAVIESGLESHLPIQPANLRPHRYRYLHDEELSCRSVDALRSRGDLTLLLVSLSQFELHILSSATYHSFGGITYYPSLPSPFLVAYPFPKFGPN